jgi:hypothetical protein
MQNKSPKVGGEPHTGAALATVAAAVHAESGTPLSPNAGWRTHRSVLRRRSRWASRQIALIGLNRPFIQNG